MPDSERYPRAVARKPAKHCRPRLFMSGSQSFGAAVTSLLWYGRLIINSSEIDRILSINVGDGDDVEVDTGRGLSLANNTDGVSLKAKKPEDAVGAGMNNGEEEVANVVAGDSNAAPTDANAEANGT